MQPGCPDKFDSEDLGMVCLMLILFCGLPAAAGYLAYLIQTS